ncbi:adaptin N terminal region-domain-containing protein [Lasiosphaeria miniovina]|uniref:AP-3 complex subunit delta n=1 Tax=Lasiosphaeria miniovina TaxID=1954250 RepID=A0AA40E7X4_9PEZI|nr:adaptin N terminal region-domain-containing protein [Lasiosphaeria miniovina]KAK0728392.1 adaptin N terminal region-domain-containing protein [Lasiosphaeria miniovina]
MFEKSLYDLIRGRRNHKGHEKEYIQNCLKECRSEIRSQDMDVKATALLKLIYLEMVGHDMSWASFHVLEVMSSPKYHQKRVGYLGAVQTFRSDTEVLMLATNLLKKDLAAAQPTIISLPIAALPHIITPSLALSVLTDLVPRLGHSHPTIRKKTIVTLYRLALVYPETLRAAWPKIKERLMDKNEDPSVTAAIVNVVCELGWRRPNDFLPLAPRLFELLVDGGNNWMAIKLIKLFATLTPLEPRLVRKLLPPLTDLIRTTPAMSLLYECINGIIQGGILGDGEDFAASEEIASLCVSKLRGMIMMNGDANLKYVALLAFNRIVVTHPFLVAQQEDVIMECIDSEDITIRIKALDLVQGMVSSENLVSIVSRLMRQLKASPSSSLAHQQSVQSADLETDSSDEAAPESGRRPKSQDHPPPLPEDYTIDVIGRILNMCSQNNYASLSDFDWYIDVLTQLVRIAPVPRKRETDSDLSGSVPKHLATDISEKIGNEIRNVAVKVKIVRVAAVRAAELIILKLNSEVTPSHPVVSGALKPLAWIVGEYAFQLSSPHDSLGHLLRLIPRIEYPEILTTCLQSVIKLFAHIAGDDQAPWTSERKASMSLLMSRVIHVLEPLALHPYLEVQERGVEFIELLKLTAEAASGQAPSTNEVRQDPPLLLTQAIPSLFNGWELNSVARGAQQNVPMPDGLDLDEPIHPNLNALLSQADSLMLPAQGEDEFETYYHQKPPATSISNEPAINRLAEVAEDVPPSSYQQAGEESYLDADIIARRKAERMERNRDDPFYILGSGSSGGTSTPIHNILEKENGPGLDIDSIPIMKLDLESLSTGLGNSSAPAADKAPRQAKPRQKIVIAADETLGGSGRSTPRNYESENNSDSFTKSKAKKLKQSLLQVDSSHLRELSLEASQPDDALTAERQQRDEAEMAQAMKEVQRLRLEMQRANERIQVAQGVPAEGIVVKKKKPKKQPKLGEDGGEAAAATTTVKVKKKKKKAAVGDGGEGSASTPAAEPVVKAKKKPKRIVQLDDDPGTPVDGL